MRYDIVFDAPTPAEAYEQAPPLAQEAAAVAKLLRELEPEHRPAYLGTVLPSERREVLLRAAALAERTWWSARTEEAANAAVRAAYAFLRHDWDDPCEVGGPIGPRSPEWDAEGGPRAYARQEYLYWLTTPPGSAQ
ncbi:hypothetical protein [Kitasatospora acidiphila]|uniref:hypothetical protein n=1 Tax=Kitasatospora acidiphila TaxID=2567942 RepID=UPI003C721681